MWQKFKRLLESSEHSKFIWDILAWVGLDQPLKAAFIFVCTSLGGILAMLGHLQGYLPAYMIGLVALGFFALAGIGANAWEDRQAKRKQKKGIPIAVSSVQMLSFSNYVGFPIDKQELDAQSIDYGKVTITNISTKEKVTIDIVLHITGNDGTNIKSMADLVGPFGMILGKDDEAAMQAAASTFGEANRYFKNPVELAPGQIERRRLEFLFTFGLSGSELRDKFTELMSPGLVPHEHDLNFDLEISDLISGRAIIMHLPAEYRGDQ